MPQPGRPKVDVPPPVSYPVLTPEETATIAPLNSGGQPDLMNYMPSRLIPLVEAQARGWTYFYDARVCRYGHQAPHFTKNSNYCVDCKRHERGKQAIGGKAGGNHERREYKRAEQSEAGTAVTVASAPRELQPDRLEKQFLVAYAATKNFDQSADQCHVSSAHMQGRMAWSTTFRLAVADLENRLNIVHVPCVDENFQWSEDIYHRFIMVYIDTGDIATARDAISVTPFMYYQEIKRNPDFAARVFEAEPLALNVLEEKATQLALRGNDKLLQKILSAKKPEYKDSFKVDMKVEERLTDDQLNSKIVGALRLIANSRRRLDTGDTFDAEPAGQIEPPEDDRGSEPSGQSEPYSDLL